jgi:hypothetical protein
MEKQRCRDVPDREMRVAGRRVCLVAGDLQRAMVATLPTPVAN